jgi:hypothetical protein
MFNTMDDEALVDFAQRGTERFDAVESLWNETSEELARRGLLAEVVG